ncbi:MAG: hypothetical protein FWE33_00635 [Defluviitaleaceae bacterium]|nr:hypothetical protein [Defluviitaleaceae bacterium]
MTNLQSKTKNIAKSWTDYYTSKGEIVTSAAAHRAGRKDKDGFYKFHVFVNVEPHHMYRFEVYEA